MSQDDVSFIKPLYNIANFMAIVPPYNTNEITKLTKHKYYSSFVIILILAVHGYFVVDIIGNESTSERTTIFVLDVMNFTLTAVLLALTVFMSSFLNMEVFQGFIAGVNEVDKRLGKNRKMFSRFLVEFLLVHFIYICIAAYDVYVTATFYEKYYYGKTILGIIETYFVEILVLLIYNFCRVIKLRFKKLNDQLQSFVKASVMLQQDNEINRVLRDQSENKENKKIYDTISDGRKVQSQLINLTDDFSTIFGWQILFLFAIIAVGILQLLNAIVLSALDYNGALIATLWMTTYAVMGIVIAVTCEMTIKESRRTATITYNLLLDIPVGSNNSQDRMLRQELSLLAEQSTNECPNFSAAGFFTVDYTVLFGLLGTVTSYVIVLIQLNAA